MESISKNIKKADIIFPIIFIIVTFFSIFTRIPFYDEAHAYLISQLNFKEIFQIATSEGHPILWYFLLKLFCFNKNLYPIPMLFLNWIISSATIVFFWKKAPFNNLFKILIIFSYPFLNYFGVIARPYGLSLLSIFLLCYYFKLSFKKPILYTILLIFACNTSIIGAICAIPFGIYFIYQIFKTKALSKKQIIIVSSLIILNTIFFVLLFGDSKSPLPNNIAYSKNLVKTIISYSIYPFICTNITHLQILFRIITIAALYSSLYVLFKNNKFSFFYVLSTFFMLTMLFVFIYVGGDWHRYFYFICVLSALWISWDEIKNIKLYNCIILLFLIFATSPYSIYKQGNFKALDTKNYKDIYQKIISYKDLKKSKIYIFDFYTSISPGIIPYLDNKGYVIYDVNGDNKTSYESIKNTIKTKYKPINPTKFVVHLDKHKPNYVITSNSILNDIIPTPSMYSFNDDNYRIKFILIDEDRNMPLAIFKIEYEKI